MFLQVTILTGGNVGIGTSNPFEKLDVSGSTIIRDNLIISGSTTLGKSSNEIVTSNVGFITVLIMYQSLLVEVGD